MTDPRITAAAEEIANLITWWTGWRGGDNHVLRLSEVLAKHFGAAPKEEPIAGGYYRGCDICSDWEPELRPCSQCER